MIFSLNELQPTTVATLKKFYDEKKEILHYLRRFGTGFEKAIVSVILTVGGEK
jgi:hypothetical protein